MGLDRANAGVIFFSPVGVTRITVYGVKIEDNSLGIEMRGNIFTQRERIF